MSENHEACVPESLRQFFAAHDRVALAFSGGCDSAYLLFAALRCGTDVTAYYLHSCFQPAFELEDAQRMAEQLGAKLRVLEMDVLSDENIRRNPQNRCYYCKKQIMSAIAAQAARDGYDTIIDGTNASDDTADRPGMRALSERGVLSPLKLCGIVKAEVRALSRRARLFTWNKPAYACLATRIPSGTEITEALLQRVERGEKAFSLLGFTDFRLRIAGSGCRIELTEAQIPLLMEKRREVLVQLTQDFSEVTLDLSVREGK